MILRVLRPAALLFSSFLLAACSGDEADESEEGGEAPITVEELGELLFFDSNLSLDRTQSCATCHEPEFAFVDVRTQEDGEIRAGSLGDDGESVGDRNAPTAAYAQFSPPFAEGSRTRFNTSSVLARYKGYLGGLFHDGRAMDLVEQAAGPPLNPGEMAMPDEEAVVERLLEDPVYEESFRHHYGESIWDDADAAYSAMTEAIAEYEETSEFAPFDSRYDRSLLSNGDDQKFTYEKDSKAAQGKALFFSDEDTSCSACHQLHSERGDDAQREVFTGFEYHNLGVPENTELRALSGAENDRGLREHIDDEDVMGQFRTPTLRNVAITSPYMHNGVFRELKTVIRFYEHSRRRIKGDTEEVLNPETKEPYRTPEIDHNLSEVELGSGTEDLSDDENIEALECFLLTLTDARYEDQLDKEKIESCGI